VAAPVVVTTLCGPLGKEARNKHRHAMARWRLRSKPQGVNNLEEAYPRSAGEGPSASMPPGSEKEYPKLAAVPPGEAREAVIKAVIRAAQGGHKLGPWRAADTGWYARCELCRQGAWIGTKGTFRGLLADSCPGKEVG
jgi:hypothetical protein